MQKHMQFCLILQNQEYITDFQGKWLIARIYLRWLFYSTLLRFTKIPILSAVVFASILFVWGIRYSNIQDEFKHFQLPDWLRDLVGIFKLSFAVMLFNNNPVVVQIGASGIAFLMGAALVTHFRFKSELPRMLPSFVLLCTCLAIVYMSNQLANSSLWYCGLPRNNNSNITVFGLCDWGCHSFFPTHGGTCPKNVMGKVLWPSNSSLDFLYWGHLRNRDHPAFSPDRCVFFLFALFRLPAYGHHDWCGDHACNHWWLQANLWKSADPFHDLHGHFSRGLSELLIYQFSFLVYRSLSMKER